MRRMVRWHGFNHGGVDNAEETTSGNAVHPVTVAVISIACKQASQGLWGEVFPEGVIGGGQSSRRPFNGGDRPCDHRDGVHGIPPTPSNGAWVDVRLRN
jgi:hypothetical protein